MKKAKNCISYIKNHAYIQNIIITILFLIMLALACNYNFKEIVESNKYLLLLKHNILYFLSVLSKSVPIIIILLLIYIWRKFATKWVIKIEKLDIGGASVVFERPEELFKQQIKNFMNTKRTLFYFDPERDNIEDTISSYYKTYEFIREKMQIYDTKSSRQSKYYEVANDMVQTLNEFLTSHQYNYRRWISKIEQLRAEDYCKGICEIQKEYWRYNEIIEEFNALNNDFLRYAETFDINTNKWVKAQRVNKF